MNATPVRYTTVRTLHIYEPPVFELGHGSQVVIRSWWPPTDIWHKYYHYPFWTDTMERTFQHRLSVIATGNAYPLTRKEWKKQLRPQGTTRRFQDKIDELSLRVLDILDKK